MWITALLIVALLGLVELVGRAQDSLRQLPRSNEDWIFY